MPVLRDTTEVFIFLIFKENLKQEARRSLFRLLSHPFNLLKFRNFNNMLKFLKEIHMATFRSNIPQQVQKNHQVMPAN